MLKTQSKSVRVLSVRVLSVLGEKGEYRTWKMRWVGRGGGERMKTTYGAYNGSPDAWTLVKIIGDEEVSDGL